MLKKLCLCILLAGTVQTNWVYADVAHSQTVQQSQTLTGRVVDEFGEPIIGATVMVKGTTNGIVTDLDGNFTLNGVPKNATIVVSYVGMNSQEIVLKGQSQLKVTLKEASIGLDEVVAIGYQSQRKADLTGAVSVVKMDEIQDIPASNPIESLQGRIPGVDISTSGDPGGDATIKIRGIGTLGDTSPLYVIDGVPTKRGLNEINSRDIESIQVLKDASSATIYGSRAANGVIIVTTKKAAEGYKKISFNASLSTQFFTNKMEVMNTKQLGQALWQANVNDGNDPNATQSLYQYDWNNDYSSPVLYNINLPEYIDAEKTMRASDTDWYDEISSVPLIQSYNLSFSNGSKNGKSMFSLGYYDNAGIIKYTFMNRLNLRANTEYNFFNDRLKVGENLSLTYTKRDKQSVAGMSGNGYVLWSALRVHPIIPVYTESGEWGGPVGGMSDVQNPVRQLVDNKDNTSDFFRVFGSAFAEVKILKDLQFRTSIGVDYYGTYFRNLRKSYSSGFLSDPTNEATTSFTASGNWIWQNTLQYNTQFKDRHKLGVMLGHEMIKYVNQRFTASRRGYALETIDYAYMDAGSSNINNSGKGTSYSLLSYFGKVDYQLDNKYIFSATIRRDGSSRFAKNSRWGTFPAFSLGWRLSEEHFIKDTGIFSDLKLRYGWGQNGNQEIADNAAIGIYSAVYGTSNIYTSDKGSAYDISGNGSMVSGFVAQQLANDDLKWETSSQHNVGVDFGFFNQKLSGSIDYFIKDTKDILISPSYIGVIGDGGSRYINGASMRNTGIEFLLAYRHNINKECGFNISANISHYTNEVTKLPKEVLTAYEGNGTTDVILGHSINSLYGYVADGLFQNETEVAEHAEQVGAGVGRIRYKNLNNDDVIDDKDRKYITDGIPKIMYGLNLGFTYKDFSLSMFFQGVYGLDVYNSLKRYTDFTSLESGVNYGTRTLEAWTPTNTSSTIPMLSMVNANDEGRQSTYFLENGSYLKLRNIQLTYNLNKYVKKTKFITGADIYLQASNLFTIKAKSFTGVDPENASNAYPRPLVTTIGLNLTF